MLQVLPVLRIGHCRPLNNQDTHAQRGQNQFNQSNPSPKIQKTEEEMQAKDNKKGNTQQKPTEPPKTTQKSQTSKRRSNTRSQNQTKGTPPNIKFPEGIQHQKLHVHMLPSFFFLFFWFGLPSGFRVGSFVFFCGFFGFFGLDFLLNSGGVGDHYYQY